MNLEFFKELMKPVVEAVKTQEDLLCVFDKRIGGQEGCVLQIKNGSIYTIHSSRVCTILTAQEHPNIIFVKNYWWEVDCHQFHLSDPRCVDKIVDSLRKNSTWT